MQKLSVIIPTFNNRSVLEGCLDSWESFASDQPVELIVLEDGCKDDTSDYLRAREESAWGRPFLRWVHENDVNKVRWTTAGSARRATLSSWSRTTTGSWSLAFIPEIIRTFEVYSEIAQLSLIRGLHVFPLRKPIERWDALHMPEHLLPTIDEGVFNWLRLTEVDIIVRPWVVKRECIDKVQPPVEAFCPIEWDEADLAYRIREGGWPVASHNYERLGAFVHLGSSTLGKLAGEKHKVMVLPNGRLFHERCQTIRRQHPRERRS